MENLVVSLSLRSIIKQNFINIISIRITAQEKYRNDKFFGFGKSHRFYYSAHINIGSTNILTY